jgi:DNA-binding MarR family transcriptional regulator
VTPEFRGLRREIALALSGDPRTLYETAKALGRRSGDIQRTIRQMVLEGIVEADTDPPTRGTFYKLAASSADALADSVEQLVEPGYLRGGQRLLLARGESSTVLLRALARRDLTGAVGWAAEWGSDGEWLLALSPQASTVQVERLSAALRERGIEVRQGRLGDEFHTADAVARLSVAIDDAIGSRA